MTALRLTREIPLPGGERQGHPAGRLRGRGRRRAGARDRLAAEEGARARQAARARARAPAAPRAGDGRRCGATATRPPPPTTSTRRCTSRGARSAPDAIEVRDEVLVARRPRSTSTRFELAAAERAPRCGTPAAYRARARALRRRAAAREPLRRLGRGAARRAGGRSPATLAARARARSAPSTPTGPSSCRPTRARSSAAGASSPSWRRCSRGTRLLTLAGTGGAGKTRLALELARAAEASYPGGAALVELAPLTDRELVAGRRRRRARRARASGAGARRRGRRLPRAARALLLVLDNCEHVLGGARRARRRAASRRAGPDGPRDEPRAAARAGRGRLPRALARHPRPRRRRSRRSELLGYEAVRLFVERAAAAAPGFALDEENAADVARICFRLDGLPLALELAAGRLGALGPGGDRRAARRPLPPAARGQPAPAPTRQQTLAATLQWSHDLLEPDERLLFRRLAVFAGGFELAAAEGVCAGDGLETAEVADVLARLVEKSLVTVDERRQRERRYRLLETVRLYARERLAEAGEAAALAERHARWALALGRGERGSPALDREAANLRAALDTLLDDRTGDALRLCVALVAVLAAADRPARGAAPVRRGARGRVRRATRSAARRCSRPARSTSGAARSPAARSWREEALRASRPSSATPHARVARAPAPRRVRGRLRRRRRRRSVARARARARAPRGPRRPEAIGIYSLGVAHWILGDLGVAEELVGESVELLRGLDPTERIPSPINIAEIRATALGERPGPAARLRGHAAAVRRDLLRRGGRLRAREPGRDRARARRPRARPERCSTRRSDALRGAGDERGELGRPRPARLPRARRGRPSSARARTSSTRSSCAAALSDRRGVGLALVRPRPDRDGRRRLRGAPSGTSPRRASSSAAPATAGGSRARSGGRPTSRSPASDSTTPRPRWRRRSPSSARRSASAGSRTRSSASPRSRSCAATPSGRPRCCAEARERYARRDDGAGVADVDERLAALLRRR